MPHITVCQLVRRSVGGQVNLPTGGHLEQPADGHLAAEGGRLTGLVGCPPTAVPGRGGYVQIAGSVSGYTGDRGRSGAVGARVLCVGLWTVDLVDGTLQHRLDVEPFALG